MQSLNTLPKDRSGSVPMTRTTMHGMWRIGLFGGKWMIPPSLENEEAGPSVNFHQILHSTHAVDFSNGRVCNLSEMESRYSSFDRDNTFLYLAA